METRAAAGADRAQAPCAHCGLPAPPPAPGESLSFCCAGCEAAWHVIHSADLEQFYALREASGAPARPAAGKLRDYAEFDDPSFLSDQGLPLRGGLVQLVLYLEGVHCAACVWLVERACLRQPGVRAAELHIGRSLLTLTVDPAAVRLGDVARLLDRLGYPPHPAGDARAEEARRRSERTLLLRLGVAGASAGNAMGIAFALYGGLFHAMDPSFRTFFHWAGLVAATPAVVYSAREFYRGAWGALRQRMLHLDVPVSAGILAGYLGGVVNTVRGAGHVYFESVTMLVFFLLVARWLQQRQTRRAADASVLLDALVPPVAQRVPPGGGPPEEVPLRLLRQGDVVELGEGDVAPADGVAVSGHAAFDESALTGESRPRDVEPGDQVWAGTRCTGGTLRVRVEAAGDQSRVGSLLRQVADAARHKAPIVRAADRWAGRFTAGVLVAAAICLVWWWRDPAVAIERTVALVVVACPCAFGLATPLAVAVALGRAARAGLVVKGGDVLEALSTARHVAFDKTGTLTTGALTVVDSAGPPDLWPQLAALERHFRHPVARAIASWGRGAADEELPVCERAAREGPTVRGIVDGHRLVAGALDAVADGSLPPALQAVAERARERGATLVAAARDGKVVGVVALADAPRPEARHAVEAVEALGWTPWVLSGDAPAPVAAVAEAVGIPRARVRSRQRPEDKVAWVHERHAERDGPVVVVGDGLNDAGVLAVADAGVAMRGGVQASLEAAGVYLARGGLEGLVALGRLARRMRTVIGLNIAWAACYNVAAAAAAFAGLVNPLVAALLMPASSLVVTATSVWGVGLRGAALPNPLDPPGASA